MKGNEARRKYYKIWRAKNKEKIKLYNDRYWKKKAEKDLSDNSEALCKENENGD